MERSESPKLPADFVDRLHSILHADHLGQTLESFHSKPKTCFRVNLNVDPESMSIQQLNDSGIQATALQHMQNAFSVESADREKLTHSSLVANGQIYIQNISSMLVVDALEPQPGEQVLDLAAAPGGKTTLIAERMKGEGYLAAVEPVRKRFFKLQANLKLHAANWVKTFLTDGRTVGQKTYERFDRILLDAPCSSEARFNIHSPETWQNWSVRKIRESSRKQNGLIRSAFRALKPGGTLVYCTCSFAPEENEQTVDHLLKKFPDAVNIQPMEFPRVTTQPGLTQFANKSFHNSIVNARRIIPCDLFNGMFVTKITKLKTLGKQTRNTTRTVKPKRRR